MGTASLAFFVHIHLYGTLNRIHLFGIFIHIRQFGFSTAFTSMVTIVYVIDFNVVSIKNCALFENSTIAIYSYISVHSFKNLGASEILLNSIHQYGQIVYRNGLNVVSTVSC